MPTAVELYYSEPNAAALAEYGYYYQEDDYYTSEFFNQRKANITGLQKQLCAPPFEPNVYCTTHLSFEGNLDALGGSLYLRTTRRPLFYFSNSELGP